jgi:hypothetical protein
LLLAAVLGFWWWQLRHPTEGLARPEATTGNQESGPADGN